MQQYLHTWFEDCQDIFFVPVCALAIPSAIVIVARYRSVPRSWEGYASPNSPCHCMHFLFFRLQEGLVFQVTPRAM